jgi:hypothetical protein
VRWGNAVVVAIAIALLATALLLRRRVRSESR